MSDGMSAPQRKTAAWATGRSTPARSTNPAITATHPSAPPGPCELLPPPRTYASGSPSRLAATSSVLVFPPSTPRTTLTRPRSPLRPRKVLPVRVDHAVGELLRDLGLT